MSKVIAMALFCHFGGCRGADPAALSCSLPPPASLCPPPPAVPLFTPPLLPFGHHCLSFCLSVSPFNCLQEILRVEREKAKSRQDLGAGGGGVGWRGRKYPTVLRINDLISQGVCLCDSLIALYNKVLHIPRTRKPIWVLSL